MTASTTLPQASRSMRYGLWFAQILLALVYIPAGGMKLFSPVAEVAAQIPWAGDVAEGFLRSIGAIDLAAGLGLLLPSLTRILPQLTVWAGRGSIVLQVCAMLFHISRGEYFVLPMNLVIIALSLYVAWGRQKKAPILARGAVAIRTA